MALITLVGRLLVGCAMFLRPTAQDLALQLATLEHVWCERVCRDTGSGTIRQRPQLDACLDYLRAGDTLVVWRLDCPEFERELIREST